MAKPRRPRAPKRHEWLAAKIGALELRERAKAALGPKFDIKAFDDTVVLGGNVPMDVLGKNVDEYIRAASA